MERGGETPEGLTFYTSVLFYSRMKIFLKNTVFFKSAKASHFYFHEKGHVFDLYLPAV